MNDILTFSSRLHGQSKTELVWQADLSKQLGIDKLHARLLVFEWLRSLENQQKYVKKLPGGICNANKKIVQVYDTFQHGVHLNRRKIPALKVSMTASVCACSQHKEKHNKWRLTRGSHQFSHIVFCYCFCDGDHVIIRVGLG